MVCRTCEICGSVALNVVGVNEAEMMEQWNEANENATRMVTAAPVHPAETRNFWQGHRFLNFLLACMVFAFVISWLFHFNVPSWEAYDKVLHFSRVSIECFFFFLNEKKKGKRRYCLFTLCLNTCLRLAVSLFSIVYILVL